MRTTRAKQTPAKTEAPFYPTGTFLKTEEGFFYVQSPSKRLRIISPRILESWKPARVLSVSELDPAVEKLKIGITKMKFRTGSLIYSQYDGKMFLVVESSKLSHITNPDWLDHLGLSRRDAVWVSKAEIDIHELGEELS